MMHSDDYEAYQRYEHEVLAEIEREVFEVNPVTATYKYVSFVSTSSGRNKPVRAAREVQFIVLRDTGKATTFENFPFDQASEKFDGDYPEISETDFIDLLLDGSNG